MLIFFMVFYGLHLSFHGTDDKEELCLLHSKLDAMLNEEMVDVSIASSYIGQVQPESIYPYIWQSNEAICKLNTLRFIVKLRTNC